MPSRQFFHVCGGLNDPSYWLLRSTSTLSGQWCTEGIGLIPVKRYTAKQQGSYPFSETIFQEFPRLLQDSDRFFQVSQMHNNWSNKPLRNNNPKILLQTILFKKTFLQEFIDLQDFPGPALIFQDFPREVGLRRNNSRQNTDCFAVNESDILFFFLSLPVFSFFLFFLFWQRIKSCESLWKSTISIFSF